MCLCAAELQQYAQTKGISKEGVLLTTLT